MSPWGWKKTRNRTFCGTPDLIAELERHCGASEDLTRRACDAAKRSAQAQWHFLDGAEKLRAQSENLLARGVSRD